MEAEIGARQLLERTEEGMKEKIEKMKKEFGALRTGRANPQVLESVKVEYYGVPVPLKQVAAVMVPEARTLEVRPWDISTLEEIDKALKKADLGAAPVNDGKVIRITLPQMTEDRRKNMVKMIKKIAEDYKVGLRNDRREAIEKLKKAEKSKEISEDELARLEQSAQKMTDTYVQKIDEALSVKEQEILTV